MQLSLNNSVEANRATASVLLLYYHLLREGGFTHSQTVYVNPEDFDPFRFLDVIVLEDLTDVDQTLLREGAAVHLLCELNDIVGEFESDYMKQSYTKRLLAAFRAPTTTAIPEAREIASMVEAGEASLNYQVLATHLASVYQRYVVSRFRELVRGEA